MCVLRTEGYVPFRTRASVHSSGAAGALGSALPTALRLLEAERILVIPAVISPAGAQEQKPPGTLKP